MMKRFCMALTIKQEKFCNYYLECGNASEAYRRAYSCDKMKSETINIKACELLSSGKVSVRVKELQAALQSRSDLNKDEAVNILTNIARANVVDMLNKGSFEITYSFPVSYTISKKYRERI